MLGAERTQITRCQNRIRIEAKATPRNNSQRSALKTKITADLKTYHTEVGFCLAEMLIKAMKVKDIIDYVQYNLMNNVLSVFDTKHRCLKQTIKMSIYLARIQSYENMHVQSAMKPIHYLLSKNKHPRTKTFENHTSKLLMSQAINKEMVTLLLTEIEVKQGGKTTPTRSK